MKIRLHLCLLILHCCMALSAEVSSMQTVQRVTSVLAGIAKQDTLLVTYKKRCKYELKPEPVVFCAQCCAQRLGMPELMGGIRGTMLRHLLDGVDTYDAMQVLLTEAEQLLKNGAGQQIVPFMLTAAKQLPYPCIRCKEAHWMA